MAVSKAGRQHLIHHGANPRKTQVVYNGVDLSRFKPHPTGQRHVFGLPENVPIVGASAQLTDNKGWFDFLDAVRELRAIFPSLHALIIGDGPLHHDIKARLRRLELESAVRMVGHIDNVEAALGCLDLFLFLSHREGLSVAIIEAMAVGLPCVVTDTGGAKEQIDNGRNGYVVPVGDVSLAVKRSQDILSDRESKRSMGDASRVFCEYRFELQQMVSNYQRIYEEVGAAL